MRILIIEDEPRILGFLARGLEAEGFSVETAANGGDALRTARRHEFDVVLLDLLLPGVDGLTVLRELVRAENKSVVIAMHDVNLASRLCDHAVLMRDGEARCGTRDEMLTIAQLEWLYQQPLQEAVVAGDHGVFFAPR